MQKMCCKGIWLNYYKDRNMATLKDVSLRLPSRGIYGICGPSGAGKSSLLYVLAGFKNKYLQGEITFGDKNILDMNENQLAEWRRNKLGFIFQKHYLIDHLNVYENIKIASSSNNGNNNMDDIEDLIKKLSLNNILKKYPKEISGGESQRVAIVRALANEPEVIIADEPTAALDSEYTRIVMNILKERSKESLIILVSHDKNVFTYFDYRIELFDGKIIRRGHKRYQSYWL